MPSDLPGDFGSGLAPSVGSPFDISPSSVNAMPDNSAPPQAAPAPQPQQNPVAQFGSSLANMLPGPHYTPLPPGSSALDQSANLLQERIDRASQIASPSTPAMIIGALFAPEKVQEARDKLPAMTEQLRTIQQQKQQQVDIQKSATNFGMPQSAQNPFMTNDTIDNWLLDQYKDGDFSKAPMLQARGRSDWVQDFAPTAADGAGQRLAAANSVVTKLNAAGNNQPAYAATLRGLTPDERQSITSLGLQIPPMASDWQNTVQQHGPKFLQAQQLQSQVMQRFANIGTFAGTVPKDVEAASQGSIRIGSSNEPAGFPVRTRAIDGQTGNVGPNGSVQMEKYGLAPKDGGWNAATTERLQNNDKLFTGADTQGAVNQYNIANKFKNEAMNDETYTSSAGLALLKDTLGGVGRDVAEKSAAAGTPALAQMFKNEQGGFEGFLNRATTEIAAYKAWVDGGKKGPPQRISDQTKRGIQFIANENYNFSQQQAAGRLSGAMRNAGQIGRPLEDIPLDADLKASVAQYHEEGRVDAINGWRSYPSVVNGNQRIFFPQGSNVMGAGAPRPPLNPDGSPQNGSANGGNPLTPVQPPGQSGPAPSGGASPAPPPATPLPSNGGGAGQPPTAPQPVTVAGQQVNVALPPGASPAYVTALQRIESGGERNPWTSGTQGSSATGAFQAIKGTWDQFKPPGAPARAADATPQQQADFLSNFTARNATALATAGLPVNDTSLYVAHNLGAGGASQLLQAAPSADARTIVGEAAAKNNPMFFKGRPTVATVLQRYSDAMGGAPASAAPTPATPAGAPLTPMQRESLARRGIETAAPGPTPEQQAGQWAQTGPALAGAAPAALSTVGGIVGTGLGGPLGGVAGGAAGGYVGNTAKNYLLGKPQNQIENAEQAALGGLLGVAGEGRPLLTAAGQAAGTAAIEAGSTLVQGGTGPEAVDAGLKGGAEALGGRLFGHALGMAVNKVYSNFTPEAQSAVRGAAKDLHEANQTLATTQPKLPTGDANPTYEAAQAAKDDAEAKIKDILPNAKPDEVAYAHKVLSEGDVPRGEALVMGRAQSAANQTSQGYNQLRQDVQNAGKGGVGAPTTSEPLPDGPVAQVRTDANPTGPVEEKFMPDAVNAERLVRAPAADMGVKWGQLQKAGTELIEKRLAFIANGDEHSAGQMDAIFKGVRNQQENIAQYVFGPDRAPQVINQLKSLDKSWATIMTGSGGLNYGKMQSVLQSGNTPQARAMATAFKSFASGDPGAMRAFNAMKLPAPTDWKMMIPIVASDVAAQATGIPTLGTISAVGAAGLGTHTIYRVVKKFMNAKVLDPTVQFKDFFLKDLQQNPLSQVVQGAVQRSVVQGVGATQ